MKIVKSPYLSREITVTGLSLPEDIIEEILSRLVVKSLLRFRCVSKSWRLLIDSKRFMKSQHRNSTKNPNFPHQRYLLIRRFEIMQCSLQNLLSETPTKPKTYRYPGVPIAWESETLGCYNGLVCIVNPSDNFFVLNPSTRVSKELPYPNHSCTTFYNPGFGWIESTGEYKVFAVVHEAAEVYSSKTKTWKTLPQWDLPVSSSAGVCVSERLHWDTDEGIDIVYFDLKSEVSGTIELPSKMDGEQQWLLLWSSLGVIGGCLCVIYSYRETGIRVWVMKEYGVKESWERVVSLPQLLELLERPLIIGPNGEILVFFGSDYLIYNPQDNVFLNPWIWKSLGLRYIESLLSPEDV